MRGRFLRVKAVIGTSRWRWRQVWRLGSQVLRSDDRVVRAVPVCGKDRFSTATRRWTMSVGNRHPRRQCRPPLPHEICPAHERDPNSSTRRHGNRNRAGPLEGRSKDVAKDPRPYSNAKSLSRSHFCACCVECNRASPSPPFFAPKAARCTSQRYMQAAWDTLAPHVLSST